MVCMYVYDVWALYGEANALYWKSFERQNSTHLTLLKHQNTKTAQYKLPKNHWVIALFWKFWACQKQFTCDSLIGSPCTKSVFCWPRNFNIWKEGLHNQKCFLVQGGAVSISSFKAQLARLLLRNIWAYFFCNFVWIYLQIISQDALPNNFLFYVPSFTSYWGCAAFEKSWTVKIPHGKKN